MDISAFVPLQDLGFGRRAARFAVQCVFRNEEETRSEFLSLIVLSDPANFRIVSNPEAIQKRASGKLASSFNPKSPRPLTLIEGLATI